MPEYLSPGVYVEEVPSAVKPIAGVSTSTACFIGLVPDTINIPYENPSYDPTHPEAAPPYMTRPFPGTTLPAPPPAGSDEAAALAAYKANQATLSGLGVDPDNPPASPPDAIANDKDKVKSFNDARQAVGAFKNKYPLRAALELYNSSRGTLDALNGKLGALNPPQGFDKNHPPGTVPQGLKDDDPKIYAKAQAAVETFGRKYAGTAAVYEFKDSVDALKNLGVKDAENPPQEAPEDIKGDGLKFAAFNKAKAVIDAFKAKYPYMAEAGYPVLCTSFNDFKRSFGDFSTDGLPEAQPDPNIANAFKPGGPLETLPPGTGLQNQLAHAVFGFFNNGGTRCYVMRFKDVLGLRDPQSLAPVEAIDEISLMAAPGITDQAVQDNLVTHCENMTSRFAILDAQVLPDAANLEEDIIRGSLGNTDYGAVYFPWIYVFDTATQIMHPDADGEILCAPSGHIAGIYSRVDHERGVYKAPANEVIRGALDLDHHLSRNVQDGLNPYGINCIRYINDNITVWGARTVGGDANTDLKYINVRRTLIFIRESIDKGTQWVVFEPNDFSLWAKITRNVTAFLTTVWRDGALFGATPQEAFYVKCDIETNSVEDRDLGRVTTEVGVAIVRPAEFVIFRISQWAGPAAQ